MELARRVPVLRSCDRNRRRIAGLQRIAVCLGALSAPVAADEPNHGYPTAIVPLKEGLVLCESAGLVEQAFDGWKLSLDMRAPARLPQGCFRTPPNYEAIIKYAYPFENAHWLTDILEFMVLKPRAPGVMVFDQVYYGYGSPKLKPGALRRLPPPVYH